MSAAKPRLRKAVITITDVNRATDEVNVSLVFDGNGSDDDSAAHRTAVEMLAGVAGLKTDLKLELAAEAKPS